MNLYSKKVDDAIGLLLKALNGFPVPVWSREFLDGYRAYYQREDCDPYELVLPKSAPARILSDVDDTAMRTKMKEVFEAMGIVIGAIMAEKIPMEETSAEIWRQFKWPADFLDRSYSDAYHFAVKCILDYEKFICVDGIEDRIVVPPELEDLYDADERLVNVSSLIPVRGTFVCNASKLAVIPKYKSEYELKEKFAALFRDGIPKDWCVWVSPAGFVPSDSVSEYDYVQEERLWGGKFDEEAFKKIFFKTYGEFAYEDDTMPERAMRTPLYKLQYAIESNDKERRSSAIVEELIDITYGQSMIDPKAFVYGSNKHYYVRHRMVHLMYDQDRSVFTHFDLSHLYYNEIDYYTRLDQILGQVKPKATKKMKVFKIDGVIPFDVITDLIGASMDGVHNPEVRKLLNGE